MSLKSVSILVTFWKDPHPEGSGAAVSRNQKNSYRTFSQTAPEAWKRVARCKRSARSAWYATSAVVRALKARADAAVIILTYFYRPFRARLQMPGPTRRCACTLAPGYLLLPALQARCFIERNLSAAVLPKLCSKNRRLRTCSTEVIVAF
jgi:hypothetical protein